MNKQPAHFAIYIDNIDRAKKFYTHLFGWEFNNYGQDDFLQIRNGDSDEASPIGALQARKYAPIAEKIIGFECSFEVTDIDSIEKTIVENGGRIAMPKTSIPYVGWILKFIDTEDNIVCAIQYDSSAK